MAASDYIYKSCSYPKGRFDYQCFDRILLKQKDRQDMRKDKIREWRSQACIQSVSSYDYEVSLRQDMYIQWCLDRIHTRLIQMR